MHLWLYLAFFLTLYFAIQTAFGKDHNTTKSITDGSHRKQNSLKDKVINDRTKRSLEGDEIPFWPNRGRRIPFTDKLDAARNDNSQNNDPMDKEPPFWGTRGRRDDSSSVENYIDDGSPTSDDAIFYPTKCKHCYTTSLRNVYDDNQVLKDSREDHNVPFWGNRGRRNSEKVDDVKYFWGNRDRRQEEDPFWGARGRREDEVPFWGNRGRRHSRWTKHDILEEPPFWGNRGRRDDVEPFWGSRGRRQESEPFWGSRGRREGKASRRRENLKKILNDAINAVEDNIENLVRTRRDGKLALNSFWKNRQRESKLSNLFKFNRQRFRNGVILEGAKPSEASTVLDDRIFAEQPHYIVVERSSRSSTEDDPFYISRGKKMFIRPRYYYTARDRRGSLEELVKSVRNDPYYIARGKKHLEDNFTGNSSLLPEEIEKAKNLICATIDLVLFSKGSKEKREGDDTDRDRRTILKKLAAQLQMDPYFASRGKKNESEFNEETIEDFIEEVAVKCN